VREGATEGVRSKGGELRKEFRIRDPDKETELEFEHNYANKTPIRSIGPTELTSEGITGVLRGEAAAEKRIRSQELARTVGVRRRSARTAAKTPRQTSNLLHSDTLPNFATVACGKLRVCRSIMFRYPIFPPDRTHFHE